MVSNTQSLGLSRSQHSFNISFWALKTKHSLGVFNTCRASVNISYIYVKDTELIWSGLAYMRIVEQYRMKRAIKFLANGGKEFLSLKMLDAGETLLSPKTCQQAPLWPYYYDYSYFSLNKTEIFWLPIACS